MRCEYCKEDEAGYKMYFPRINNDKGLNMLVSMDYMTKNPCLKVFAPFNKTVRFPIRFCPMCGERLCEK